MTHRGFPVGGQQTLSQGAAAQATRPPLPSLGTHPISLQPGVIMAHVPTSGTKGCKGEA